MSKSQRISVQDVQALLRISHECRDLGCDAQAWRTHFYAELAKLIDADLVLGGELGEIKTGQARSLGTTEWGWDHGFDRSGWQRALECFAENPDYSHLLSSYFARFVEQNGICLQRTDLIPDAQWYRSDHYQEVHRTMGTDHSLFCSCTIPNSKDDANGIMLYRAEGRRPFSQREYLLVHLLHQSLALQIGGSLARYTDDFTKALAPRLQDVLRALIEGDSDKQIALRLGISKYTVQQYTKALYRHFNVMGRNELFARWIRRYGQVIPSKTPYP